MQVLAESLIEEANCLNVSLRHGAIFVCTPKMKGTGQELVGPHQGTRHARFGRKGTREMRPNFGKCRDTEGTQGKQRREGRRRRRRKRRAEGRRRVSLAGIRRET